MFPYMHRPDGRIAVSVDSCAWNFLMDHHIDLRVVLPITKFALYIPQEVEIELKAMSAKPEKLALAAYIRKAMERSSIDTSSTFGFYQAGLRNQRVSGFGQGTWASSEEQEIRAALAVAHPHKGVRKPTTDLWPDEADRALAVSAFSSVVLTAENPTNNHPIQWAAANGGKVVSLYEQNGTANLRELVERCYHR